jgi:hypothetical protein
MIFAVSLGIDSQAVQISHPFLHSLRSPRFPRSPRFHKNHRNFPFTDRVKRFKPAS